MYISVGRARIPTVSLFPLSLPLSWTLLGSILVAAPRIPAERTGGGVWACRQSETPMRKAILHSSHLMVGEVHSKREGGGVVRHTAHSRFHCRPYCRPSLGLWLI